MAVGIPPSLEAPEVAGFKLSTAACGIKANGKQDLLLVRMEPAASVAGVFTRNQVVAAPVQLCRDRLSEQTARGLLVNSGNANACNGPQGMLDALALSHAVSDALNAPDDHVFVSSTGVIGEALPVEKPLAVIKEMAIKAKSASWDQAAKAIMTTDTFPKVESRIIATPEGDANIVGIAKGAGMIHPNMATLLVYLFTDATVAAPALQTMLKRAMTNSFNSITVDGDTSTNDTVLLFASGAAGLPEITDADHPSAKPVADAINEICQALAHWIIKDAEGATKFISVTVSGARSVSDAKQIAMTVAKSPLVKTACYGNDPNWGRILAAVGYAEVPLDVDAVDIFLGDVQIVSKGGRAGRYTEQAGKAVMQKEEIAIHINLNLGDAHHTVWTSDLSQGYVSINADYRT
ncbi:MAG: bifunctional glutamate N-acetyltransferase/amino-acid acetyltransferase ArgJ [Magnetococcales bacterium]|nr:bifunctional glutamate N-acetyltransferase/amino-acid acetyltransferase ArgJ [Magnetococcales bacterium]